MKVVASVQAKRGSSRGLVHYIAHSKLDNEKEPQNSRELFNEFTDDLSVKSANNSMRIGVAKGRPSNDELHHLVLSFRGDDYRKLGADEARRRHALKEITREAMKSLEIPINTRRLAWAAAVHLNTENPHVHIAIQKQYFTKEIERRVLTRFPREALPHYEARDTEKILVPGFLIEAATERMEAIIDREKTRPKAPVRDASRQVFRQHLDREIALKPTERSTIQIAAERDALAKGILAEYELRSIGKRIDNLLDHGDKMRFTVNDPISGRKRRISLREIEQKGNGKESDRHDAPARQIKTILHKMLAKEEAAKSQLQRATAVAIQEAERIRGEYRKCGRKLPVPSLTKGDLDRLQQECFDISDIRRFSYLERTRTELERSGEIETRSNDDLKSILAQKTISRLRSQLHEKRHAELSERGYYRHVKIGDRTISLTQLDREQKERGGSVFSIFEKLKLMAARLSKRSNLATRTDAAVNLRNDIVKKLDEQLAGIRKEWKVEQNKVQVLENILNSSTDNRRIDPLYSPEQIAEIEKLSVRLKLKPEYEKNWNDQRFLIESAGSDSAAYRKLIKADPTADFKEHKNHTIAGRSLARQIVARVGFEKAKEDLKTFQEAKRFQKFAIADMKSGNVAFLGLHDVDLSQRGSLLDRALEELFEGSEHRALRQTVSSLVKYKEQRLKNDVTAAKEIMVSAARSASEFKEFSFFGLRNEAVYQPIFTSAEIVALELRAENTRSPKEAERLRTILESAAYQLVRSTTEILRDFENPTKAPSEVKEIYPLTHDEPGRIQAAVPNDGKQKPVVEKNRSHRTAERSFQDHSR